MASAVFVIADEGLSQLNIRDKYIALFELVERPGAVVD